MKLRHCIYAFALSAALMPAGAAAQDSVSDSTAVDSSAAAGTDGQIDLGAGLRTGALWWVEPKWKLEYKANESTYRLGTGMDLEYMTGDGWTALSNIKMTKRDYRGRDMEDLNELFTNSAARIVPDVYTVNVSLGQNYLRQKAIGLARSGGAMVVENKSFSAAATWERPELWARKSRFGVMGGVGGGQNDFKYDKNMEAGASGHLWYVLTDAMSVDGGYGIWRKTEDSDVSGRKFTNMPSNMDTIKAGFDYGEAGSELLAVTYDRSVGVLRKVDPPRGNALEVIENPDLAMMERTSTKKEKLTVSSRIEPMSYLAVDFNFSRDYFDQQNVVDKRLSKETEARRAGAKASYTYAEGGRINFDVERNNNNVDYGPVSLSSYVENERVIKLSLTQQITDSLSVAVRGSGSLKQRYFKKSDANPRDADYLYYSFFAELNATLPMEIETGVKFTYKQFETINIDRSLSGDNRTDFTYWVVPRFSLRPKKWIEIGQEYEIKMEFTDFTFRENENFLDRTTIMNTTANFNLFMRRLLLGIRHSYLFTDTGSYLRPEGGGERLYGRTSENFEHRFNFRFEYAPTKGMSVFSNSNYRFQQSNRLGFEEGRRVTTDKRFYDSGELQVGIKRGTKITESGTINLNIAWVRRFGPNLTPERREFWEVDMNMTVNF